MMTPIIQLIACIDSDNYGIGKDNDLLYNIPEDKKHFRDLTLGKPVIMGRKTQKSLPKGFLDKRLNIVLTSKNIDSDSRITYVHDINSAIMEAYKSPLMRNNEIMIIGGESVYKQFSDIASYAHITFVKKVMVHEQLPHQIHSLKPDALFPSEIIDTWRIVYESSSKCYLPSMEEIVNSGFYRLEFTFRVYQNPNVKSIPNLDFSPYTI